MSFTPDKYILTHFELYGADESEIPMHRVHVSERRLGPLRQYSPVEPSAVGRRGCGPRGLVIAHAEDAIHVLALGVLGAVEILGPVKAEPLHDGLAARLSGQTQSSTRGYRPVEDGADGHEHGAEEELQVRTAADFD